MITLLPHVLDQVLLCYIPVRANVLAGIHQTVFGLLIVCFFCSSRAASPRYGIAAFGRRRLAVPVSQRAAGSRMTALLEIEGLEVVYGHVIRAIQGVSFVVEQGHRRTRRAKRRRQDHDDPGHFGILPTENVRITDGRMRFDGASIRDCGRIQTARLGISVVPEREKVFDTLTVRENLELSCH